MSYIKLFSKIVNKNKAMIIVSFVIAVVFSVLFMGSVKTIEDYKPVVCIVDRDNSSLSKKLQEEIQKYVEVKVLQAGVNPEDRIIEGAIESYIEIPKGLEENFLQDKEIKVHHISIKDSRSESYLNNKIDMFLNNAQYYFSTVGGNIEKFYDFLANGNSGIELSVNGLQPEEEQIRSNVLSCFNFISYGVFFGVGNIVAVFLTRIRRKEIKDRYMVSPVTNKSYLFQLIVANFLFLLLFIAALVLMVGVLIIKSPIDVQFWLNSINLVCYGLFTLSFALLIGMLIKKTDFANAITTAGSLVFSFLGGLFVPMEFFSDTIKLIASFTPAYWYEKAALAINTTGNLDMTSIVSGYGIQLLFAITLLGIVAVIHKQKMSA